MVLDRWRWIGSRLPREESQIVDAGCGNGWFTMNAARKGHNCIGLGFDDSALGRARARSAAFGTSASYEVEDLRHLEDRSDLVNRFDVAVCSEVIEHIIDDQKVINNLAKLVRPGGLVLITTPHADYRPVDEIDAGPFVLVEDGGHVRKGYTSARLSEMCSLAGLEVTEVGGCSGFGSQRLTWLLRALTKRVGYRAAWLITLPVRPVACFVSGSQRSKWPLYSLCLAARRPAAPRP